jgi:hypothetical protein
MGMNKQKGNIKHGNRWKGGRSLTSHGYILLKMPEHPRAHINGYVYEHIIVAEEKLGRALAPSEIVHYIDANRQNNDPQNIAVMKSIAHHKIFHRLKQSGRRLPGEDNPIVHCACGCGGSFLKYDKGGRPRKYLLGHWRKGRKGGWHNAFK